MEFNKNNSKSVPNQEIGLGLNQEKKGGFRSFVKKALDSQVFFNSRLKALEYIEKQGQVSTAMLTLNIEKVKGFLGMNCKLKFSLLYSTTNGQTFQTKDFYIVEMPGKEGMIPEYILKELATTGTVKIKFNLEDLSTLYDERSVKIDEESTFDELIEVCKKENVATIQMIDRVFYTRIECLDAANQQVGTIHVGALYGLPKELANVLYPCGQATFDV